MQEAITVSRLNTYIKQIFDAEEFLHNIRVVGEIFGVSRARNVIYFSLKDENATLPCVCFYPNYESLIEEGDSVIVTGSPNFYVKGGKLNFNVVKVEKQGQGKLFEEFLAMKEKLEKDGLFDITHKKPLPKTINRIGVITSKEGAVIQDIKNVAWRRNPSLDIVLFNTKVQGLNAENEIAHAIEVLGKYDKIDVIVVARGGGSLEDLKAYNTEVVARATYNCPKPIISAVGHETDFTIIDFVSDLRAPTPSAGAELVTNDSLLLKEGLVQLSNRLIYTCKNSVNHVQNNISVKSNTLIDMLEKTLIKEQHYVKIMENNFTNAGDNYINTKLYEIGLFENTLAKINPKSILDKGYAKVEQDGKSVSSCKDVDNKEFQIIFKDGRIKAKQVKGENI